MDDFEKRVAEKRDKENIIDDEIERTADDIVKREYELMEKMKNLLDKLHDLSTSPTQRTKIIVIKREAEYMFNSGSDIVSVYKFVYDSLNNIGIPMTPVAIPTSLINQHHPKNLNGSINIPKPPTNSYNDYIQKIRIKSPPMEPATTIEEKNPYGFDYDSVEDEDLIRTYVDGDIPVFLHGLSGSGKSDRVLQIDPNCVKIYMASAKPETVAGKSAVINGEVRDIPPEWYVKICELCEKEPNKNHILFFDEITNAPPSLQGLAYNIILNKEVNGKWKLPSNCRIVAAGNEMDESLAANEMPEPLFRRMAHVYVQTTIEKWVLWASEHKLHPAIISFIVSNGYDTNKNKVFRTECNGKDPCVDPRKWEMASKLLKQSNNPRTLLGILGKDITDKFVEFVRAEYISLDQVIRGDYDKSDGKVGPDKAHRIVNALCGVDADNVRQVVDYIRLRLYPENYELFKKIWTAGGKDKKRVNILLELELKKQMEEDDSKAQGENLDVANYGGSQRRGA